ncbi:MAG: AAA family ATPase [Coriobacteriales bacterium]|nr:AAA family ATPase [Coriobacteriales bacterium]
MGIRIPIGYDSFEDIRRNGSYYVDKTGLLWELFHESDSQVTLFTRPRRFGKSLNISTLECFLNIRKDSKELFEGLEVTQHKEFCAEWMNSSPVISLSLKDAAALTFRSAYAMLKAIIAETCLIVGFLEHHEFVDPYDVEVFRRLRAKTATDEEVRESLRTLTRMMHAAYGRPCVLLVDEYDVPLAKASQQKEAGERYYPQMLEVIRGLMSSALKSNPWLDKAIITGCLRMSKESIFTGVNNFASYSVLDKRFSRYFGFTHAEVEDLLVAAGLEKKAGLFRDWYDGYVFGSERVFCPWDVANYASALIADDDALPQNYWRNSSGNGVVRELASFASLDVSEKLETLMNGGTITQRVSDQLTYDTMLQTEEGLWSVLVMTGYLSKADPTQVGDTVALRIPNREVAGIFQSEVMELFAQSLDTTLQDALMEALWSGDEAGASDAMSGLLWDTISYHDYGEDYYHAFLAGVFVGRGYGVDSNREHGLGRPDIFLTDRRRRRALIIEAKRSTSASSMEHDCMEAVKQIDTRAYARRLHGYRTVLCYGVAFYKKDALVRKTPQSTSQGEL